MEELINEFEEMCEVLAISHDSVDRETIVEFFEKYAKLKQLTIDSVVVPKGKLVCEHPLDKRASVKSQGKDFCWKCGEHIAN